MNELPTGKCRYHGRERQIYTYAEFPPIPTTDYDYGACFVDSDQGEPVAFGPTPEAAIDNLIESILDSGEDQ